MIKLLLDLNEGLADPSASGSKVKVLGSDRIELLAYPFDCWLLLGCDYKVRVRLCVGFCVGFGTWKNGLVLLCWKVDGRDGFSGKKREVRWSESESEREVHGYQHQRKTNQILLSCTVPFSNNTVSDSTCAKIRVCMWTTWE